MNKKILVIGMVMLLGMLAVSVMSFNVIAQKDDNNIINNDNVKDNKINVEGDMTEYSLSNSSVYPYDCEYNPNNNYVYFTEIAMVFGRITSNGNIREWDISAYVDSAGNLVLNSNYTKAYIKGDQKICKINMDGTSPSNLITLGGMDALQGRMVFNPDNYCIYVPVTLTNGSKEILKITESGTITHISLYNATTMSFLRIFYNPNDKLIYYISQCAFPTNIYYFCAINDTIIKKRNYFLSDANGYSEIVLNNISNIFMVYNGDKYGFVDSDANIIFEDTLTHYIGNIIFNNKTEKFYFTSGDDYIGKLDLSGNEQYYSLITSMSTPIGITFNYKNNTIWYCIAMADKIAKMDAYEIPSPSLNPDVVITNPTTWDNYTTRELIEVMGGGTGDYINGVNITIDYYCYFVSNSTTIHFDNYTKINDYETGWYVDDFQTFGFNETNVIRLVIRCLITPGDLCKDDNASDVVWGISEAVTITKMAVRIYTPNGYENYTAESTQEIIFNVTYIQEFFTVNIEVSLSINGIDGDYTIINETEVMMGEENLYYNETVTWETPDNLSYDCFIKVNVSATIPTYLTDMLIDYAEDKSDDNFTIYKPSTIPPIIPPSSTITITYIQIGNWQLGNITEATAYAGEDIPILIKAVSEINLYSIDIIYHINNGTEKLIGMELQNGTTKNGYWLGYIPAQEEGTIVTFHIYALNVQGDSKTTEDIEITIITEPITEELEWDTICIWLILILAVIIVIAAIFRRK